jgi:glc operon protein GlcG
MRNAIAYSLLLGVLVLPPQDAAAQFAEKKVLTLDMARKMVAAAESEAARMHLAGVVAVVDDGGWLILVERMDHAAYLASVELAPGKARAAALFKKPSQALEDAINNGRFAAVTAPNLVEMQGGLPIVVNGEVIGAIGASFDTPEHDVQIAQVALVALRVEATQERYTSIALLAGKIGELDGSSEALEGYSFFGRLAFEK